MAKRRKSKSRGQAPKGPKGPTPDMMAAAQQGSMGGPFGQGGPPGGGMPGRPM